MSSPDFITVSVEEAFPIFPTAEEAFPLFPTAGLLKLAFIPCLQPSVAGL